MSGEGAFHMERIECQGERQLKFVQDTGYIREAGTEGEYKAAEYILQAIKDVSGEHQPRQEFFDCPDYVEKKARLMICEPYEKSYTVKAYLNGACTKEEGITAPFLYVGKGDEISLKHAKGAVVLVCETVREAMCQKLLEAGALGFITVCGTPLDEGCDRIPMQYRRGESSLPGAAVHYVDAVEMLGKGALVCHLTVLQERITRKSSNIAVRVNGTEFPEEIVTVTAHYDSVPEGPGAYDNMSGAAMVFEALHYFTEHKPKRSIEFIWFGAEEKGLVGSQAYAKNHKEELKKHIFNLNVDLAGQLIGGNVLGITADASVCEAIRGLLEEQDLPADIKNQVWASDSNTFAWNGIPALTVNRDGYGMHTRHDTASLISPWALSQGARLLTSMAFWLANESDLSFEQAIPKEMQEALDRYFDKNA